MSMKKYIIAILLLINLSPVFALLNTPAITAPANGSINNAPNVLLDWSAITGATGYEYKLSTDAGLIGASIQTVTGTSQANTSNLFFGTVYYWQVRAIKTTAPIDSSNWSVIWNFTTIDQLSLVSPSNGATNQAPNVLLDWSALSGITYYDYQWDTTASFNSPLNFIGSVAGGSSQVNTANLRFGTKYYWRARARHSADTTQWTATWDFTTTDQLTLVSPSNSATNQAPNVLLDWSPLSGITYYDYQWDTTASFNSPLNFIGSVAGGSSQANTANLLFGTKYYWRARARHTADTSQWTATWDFTTTDQLILVSPSNSAINQAPNVLLDWSPLTGITYYDYQWDTTASFNSPLNFIGSVAGGSSQANTANLRFGTKYYWRARARHTADTSQWTPTWDFTTTEYLTHVSPANIATGISLNPIIDWNPLSGITGYQYQYSTDISFSSPSLFTIGAASSQANLVNLSYGTQYFWQVRACHSTDTSEWSIPWSFTTLYQLTTAPSLISPANSAINIPVTGTSLQWSSVSSATMYEYQYDNNALFTSPVANSVTGLNDLTGTLIQNTTYYWRVRAGNGSGYSPWSVIWSFTTETVTNITNAGELESFSIYPNPSSGKFYLKCKDEYQVWNIEVFNSNGTKVLQQDRMNEIDLTNHPKGIYFIKCSCEDKVIHERIVVH